MKDFSFSINQNILFGKGYLNRISEVITQDKGKKVLLVSDKGIEKLGLVERTKTLIEAAGYQVQIFCEIETNPDVSSVYQATEVYHENHCEMLVALGGGSPMDVAKAVAVIAKYGGKVQDYEGSKGVPGPIAPIIAIPTTAGTGSEVTGFSVISDRTDNFKYSLISDYLKPEHVILDPELVMSMPARVAAYTGVDAFIHAMETYISLLANPFSDALAKEAMSLIGKNIRKFVANRNNESAAANMLIASTLAGIAFSNARLGNIHAMSHPVSARYNTIHGVANAALMPAVLRFNKNANCERYLDIYNCLAISPMTLEGFYPDQLIDEVEELLRDIDMPTCLAEISTFKNGISEDVVMSLAEDAMKSGNVYTNPTSTTKKDIVAIYNVSLNR